MRNTAYETSSGNAVTAAIAADKKHKQRAKAKKVSLARANTKLRWTVNLICAILPLIASWIISFFVHTEESVAAYKDFCRDFVASGSFLWLSMTLLVLSLLDLLLDGFRRNMSAKRIIASRIAIILSWVLLAIFVPVYFINIAVKFRFTPFCIVSVAVFLVFTVVSAYLTFFTSKEGR